MNLVPMETMGGMFNELLEERKISQSEYDLFRTHHTQLYGSCNSLYENRASVQKHHRKLQDLLIAQQTEVERQRHEKLDKEKHYHDLMKKKERLKKELSQSQEQRNQSGYDLKERDHDLKILRRKVEAVQDENRGLFEPKVKTLKSTIEEVVNDNAEKIKSTEKEKELIETQKTELEELVKEAEESSILKAKRQVDLRKIQGEPDRLRKQGDIVEKAVLNLEKEIERLSEEMVGHKELITKERIRKKQVEDEHLDLDRKIETHQKNIKTRIKDKARAHADLETQKQIESRLRESRVEIEIKEREAENHVKTRLDSLTKLGKEFDAVKRVLKKEMRRAQDLNALIPNLKLQLNDCVRESECLRSDQKRARNEYEKLKSDREKLMQQVMQKTDISEERKRALLEIQRHRAEMETELEQWHFEESNMNKMIALLKAQREMKGREASKALHNEKETIEEKKVKDLVIFDLTKKLHEMKTQMKEYTSLYDVVKNERNKYTNQTQVSLQAMSEMKEKIKILQSEIEILRDENLMKSKRLEKDRTVQRLACNQRDQMRLDVNRCQNSYREKQDLVEQQIVEIDKLSLIISSLETDMLRLKKRYESAIETRNQTGIQLIDRNDELCILYERSNIQEDTLKSGEIKLQELDQSVRMLRIELKEISRQIDVAQRLRPEMKKKSVQTEILKRQLEEEKRLTEQLCEDLETPSNSGRWRLLGGKDPTAEELKNRTRILEGRLNMRKEQVLEKELVLEEIMALANRLRNQAEGGREDTLKTAKRLNFLQSKIKDVTRKMMSIVSELSMYQATAIKLQQDKEDRLKQLKEANERMDEGLAPTKEIESEWNRHVRDQNRRLVRDRIASISGGGIGKRSTATPRPNAYIPENGLGVPKPYGSRAPFKPSVPGSTMRHIKKPREKKVLEI